MSDTHAEQAVDVWFYDKLDAEAPMSYTRLAPGVVRSIPLGAQYIQVAAVKWASRGGGP